MRGCGTPARPPAYVGAPALLVIVGIHLRNELPAGEATEPSVKVGWSVAVLSYPPLAVGQFDSPEKTETYWIFRDPEGGRTDDFAGRRKAKSLLQNSKSIARWRIEPIGGAAFAEIATRMEPAGAALPPPHRPRRRTG